jgi:protein-disulfide isomerase
VTDLKKYAQNLGLDSNKFNTCLDSGETADIVKADLIEGQKIGVSGTPTIIINGKKIVGALPFAAFEQEIEAALKK